MGYVKTQRKVWKCVCHWFDYGIMLCLMSFTHGWVVTNHPVLSGPEISVSPSLSLSTPLVSRFLHFSSIRRIRHSVAHPSGNGNQWRALFEKLFVFFSLSFPLSPALSLSRPHFHFRSALKLIPMLVLLLIFILCKCSINARGMNMKIRCQASLHEIAFGKNEWILCRRKLSRQLKRTADNKPAVSVGIWSFIEPVCDSSSCTCCCSADCGT